MHGGGVARGGAGVGKKTETGGKDETEVTALQAWFAERGASALWRGLGFAGFAIVAVAAQDLTFYLVYMQVPLAIAAAFVGWQVRCRCSDGLWLAAPVLAAHFVEPHMGAWAIVCIALPCHALSARPRFSALVACSCLALLLAATHLKARFAGTPLTWQDIHFFFAQFRDNVGVMGTQPTLLLYTVLALLALGCVIWIGWRLDRPRATSIAPRPAASPR